MKHIVEIYITALFAIACLGIYGSHLQAEAQAAAPLGLSCVQAPALMQTAANISGYND